ncbi:MAG: peptide chain release factor N(5)-glutamine methyltransferase [Vicingaceae bacterium]|nr:peptide chain release factor N(5)-glutamine methyltransferase [Vicingaceae bacterium]
MKMPNNSIKSAKCYFKDELVGFYGASEIEQMVAIVFQHYFHLTKVDLLLSDESSLSESELLKVIYAVKELKQFKPLAYIIGGWEFYGLPFRVNEFTLIPRPETEELVDLILRENTDDLTVLDIGTGSGCIPISLKKNKPTLKVLACEISTDALVIAENNAESNNVDITFFVYDILANKSSKLDEGLDIIVSNPPYITNKEKAMMSENVLDYEPHLALFVEDETPLIFYNAISQFAQSNLKAGGKLYFEINENFGNEVKDMLLQKGFKNVDIIKDINTKDRIVKASL